MPAFTTLLALVFCLIDPARSVTTLLEYSKSPIPCEKPKSITLPLYVDGEYGANITMEFTTESSELKVTDYKLRVFNTTKVPVVLIDAFHYPRYGMFPFFNTYMIDADNLGWEQTQPALTELLSRLDRPVATISLERSELLNNGEAGGFLTFGDIDSERCSSDGMKYIECGAGARWEFTVRSVRMNTDFLDMRQYANDYNSSFAAALLTTASPFIVVPEAVYVYLTNYIPYDVRERQSNRTGPLMVPCNVRDTMPDIVIDLAANLVDGIVQLRLSPYDYIRPTGSDDKYYCGLMISNEHKSGYSAYQWIFGSSLLRPYCAVLDFEIRKLAFTPRKDVKNRD